MPQYHLLRCGHLVKTESSDGSCAPNCWPFQDKNKPRTTSAPDFYCRGCRAPLVESNVPEHYKGAQAETLLNKLLDQRAKEEDRDGRFRACYVAEIDRRISPREQQRSNRAQPATNSTIIPQKDDGPAKDENDSWTVVGGHGRGRNARR